MVNISVQNISANLGNKQVLQNVSLNLKPGELVALVGPNGAGKSSLLMACLNAIPISSGNIKIDEKNITDTSEIERARFISYLPQIRPLAWPLKVKDTVALGRYAWGASPGRLTVEDEIVISHALLGCQIDHLAERPTDQLSGGELARVHCARAFVARTPLLLADEPVTALDPKHQLRILSLIRKYVDEGSGALVIMHDLALAGRFADRMIWLKEGQISAQGSVHDTLTPELIETVFDVDATVRWDGPIPSVTIQDKPLGQPL